MSLPDVLHGVDAHSDFLPPSQERHTFEPDDVEAMSEAFTDVCDALGLKERDDPATRT